MRLARMGPPRRPTACNGEDGAAAPTCYLQRKRPLRCAWRGRMRQIRRGWGWPRRSRHTGSRTARTGCARRPPRPAGGGAAAAAAAPTTPAPERGAGAPSRRWGACRGARRGRRRGGEGAPGHRVVAGRVGARVLVRGSRVVRDGGAAAVGLERARHPGVADEQVQLRPAVGEGGGAAALAAVAPVEAGAAQQVPGLALQPARRMKTTQPWRKRINLRSIQSKAIEGKQTNHLLPRFGCRDISP